MDDSSKLARFNRDCEGQENDVVPTWYFLAFTVSIQMVACVRVLILESTEISFGDCIGR